MELPSSLLMVSSIWRYVQQLTSGRYVILYPAADAAWGEGRFQESGREGIVVSCLLCCEGVQGRYLVYTWYAVRRAGEIEHYGSFYGGPCIPTPSAYS